MLLNVISTTFVRDDAADKISTLSRFCAGVLFVTILLHFISSLAENNANGDAVDDSNGIENCEQTSTRIHTAGYITNTIYRHRRIITQIYVYRKTDWPTLFYIFAHTHKQTPASERALTNSHPFETNSKIFNESRKKWQEKKSTRIAELVSRLNICVGGHFVCLCLCYCLFCTCTLLNARAMNIILPILLAR